MPSTFECFVCHETRAALAGLYAERNASVEILRSEERHFDRALAALERLKWEAGTAARAWGQNGVGAGALRAPAWAGERRGDGL